MKHLKSFILVALCISFMFATQAMARRGVMGGNSAMTDDDVTVETEAMTGNGAMTENEAMANRGFKSGQSQSLACTSVLDGVPTTIAGIVAETQAQGGLNIDDGTQIVTVYGLGPVWYWSSQGVDRPAIGDEVVVDASLITLSDGSEKLIIMSIEVNGETIDIRDAETGCHLW